ncbi:flagellar basal body-associated FliL family protein [Zavarzinia sp. CC-PAN008]|uniref:flagellar basal body-associated FliL family protein n=1 Tax=Zavarzinia sp. CC-PAN008 TaxID=3243332 RepID=UPI003F7451DC
MLRILPGAVKGDPADFADLNALLTKIAESQPMASKAKAEGAADGDAPKKGGKKKLLLILAPVVLLLGGGAGAYLTGMLDPLLGVEHAEGADAGHGGEGDHAAAEEDHAEAEPTEFYDLPEMLVNLSSTGNRVAYLKIKVALEYKEPEAKAKLEQLSPRVVDNFQTYLRELRADDIQGSAGMFRLKEELLARVNLAVKPVKVTDVLFKEVLVQ